MSEKKPKSLVPSELVDLPSKGWFYPSNHPLASGQIDIYLLTAAHEDILTSTNLIMKGVVIDRLLEALIATPDVKYSDLLIGDRNAIMIAARILGYGKKYDATITCPECECDSEKDINLEEIESKDVPFKDEQRGKNEFYYTLPMSKKVIGFKLLTQGDETAVNKELEGMKKVTKSDISKDVTTRMRHAIISVDGSTDGGEIRTFVENMPARDAKEFRKYTKSIMPDVVMEFNFTCPKCTFDGKQEVPITYKFFWPE